MSEPWTVLHRFWTRFLEHDYDSWNFTDRMRSTVEGNVFTGICLFTGGGELVCPGGGGLSGGGGGDVGGSLSPRGGGGGRVIASR